MTEIKLPPLPYWTQDVKQIGDMTSGRLRKQILKYATEAIEADRQARGEPVAWVKPDIVEKQFINMRPRRVWWECNEGIGVAIYEAPQPQQQATNSRQDSHEGNDEN